MWIKEKNRYELYTGNFTGVIISVKQSKFRFYWAIYHTGFLHPTTGQKPPDVEGLILSSSDYVYSLREAKKAVQERILEYKITDGVGKAKYKQMAM